MSVESINAHFKREGMRVTIDYVRPCTDVEETCMLLADPILQEDKEGVFCG